MDGQTDVLKSKSNAFIITDDLQTDLHQEEGGARRGESDGGLPDLRPSQHRDHRGGAVQEDHEEQAGRP